MILSYKAVCLCSEADNDIAERAVVHIQTAFPDDLTSIDVQLIALMDVVVKQGSQQVVCRGDGVEIAGKMQVQVFHRDNLRITAAGGTTLDAEAGAQGGLAQCKQCFFAHVAKGLAETDACRGLALACRCRVDGGYQHQFSVRAVFDLI